MTLMYELKTKENEASVEAYLQAIEPEQKQTDCREISSIMSAASGFPPKMWGTSIVGFGSYHYKYPSGHEGDASLTGFSARKRNITIYILPGFDTYEDLMDGLGKFKIGKSCLYINSLADIDREILKELIAKSVEHMKQTYPPSGSAEHTR